MTGGERWARVDDALQKALSLPASERAQLVQRICGDDTAMRDEVMSLLAHADSADPFLERSTPSHRLLQSGETLGTYQIKGHIGSGGMGEVYRARDTRLDRDVAIKILPPAFFADAERVARFQREAKILASLNHPHIAAIYGLEEGDGVRALVMELVEGEDLAQRLTRGSIPLDEALPIAKQIAEALEAAHDRGIIHRDLKPANIKLRRDGTVKVLDFGLAKAIVGDAEMPDLADSPTVTAVGTRAGTILGTASYMSPEQAKGGAVDRRTDLWAFGAVLYELLTGTRAFPGESVAEILSHVLTQAPNWALLPAGTPATIRTQLRRCLEKNPKRRLDSAVTLRLEIDDVLASAAGVTTAGAPQARGRRITWQPIAAVVAASLITALGTWAATRNEPPSTALPVRFTITPPLTEPMEFNNHGRDIAVSPDGRYLVYQSRSRLMLRALDQLDAVPVSSVIGRTPFFSPDSKWIGFFDGGDLKKVGVTGEPVIPLCQGLGVPNGGTWGDDGTIVVSSRDVNVGLRRCSADGPGEATELTRTDAVHPGHLRPSMLPGGRGVLFTIMAPPLSDVAVLDLKSGQQKILVRGTAATYLDSGHLAYMTYGSASGTLWVVGFDLDRLALRGEPFRVSETLQVDVSSAPNYAVSRTGALAYVPARAPTWSLVWVNRKGVESAALPPRQYGGIGLSRDGTRLAFTTSDRLGLWVWDFAQEKETRVTFGPGREFLPMWTPDGRRIVFGSSHPGTQNLYIVAADGSGAVEQLTTGNHLRWPNSITPDGTTLLFCEARPNTGYDILRLPLPASQGAGGPSGRLPEATVVFSTAAAEFAPSVSPDGHYFAYRSETSGGRDQIFVRSYPDASRGPWQISTEGGAAPVWSQSGSEIFYLDASNTMMAVPVDTSGPQFRPGRPAKVFDTKYWGNFFSYGVTKDGRFLMIKESTGDRSQAGSIVVVLNWFEELKGRMPAR